MRNGIRIIATASPNTGLPTWLGFVQTAFGEFGNPDHVMRCHTSAGLTIWL